MNKRFFVDQMGRRVQIPLSPKRIISLVPSQTELLAYLGLEKEVVGITKFCIHPINWFNKKQRIGGTKNLKIESIIDLKPDLIIGNKEENTETDISKLTEHFPVWMSDVNSFDDSLKMIIEIGKLTNTTNKTEELIKKIDSGFRKISKIGQNKSVIYCIWDNPTMVVGKNTFIDSLITKIGLTNLVETLRYPLLETEKIKQPDFVFLSSEPYPFSENHIQKFKKQYPKSKIILVDGEMFSWYGSRLIHAPQYLDKLFESLIQMSH